MSVSQILDAATWEGHLVKNRSDDDENRGMCPVENKGSSLLDLEIMGA